MKIVAENNLLSGTQVTIKVFHQNHTPLVFSGGLFSKDKLLHTDRFLQLNEFLQTQPEEVLDRMFSIYEKMRYDLENISKIGDLSQALTVHIRDLMNLVYLKEIESWVAYSPNVYIPESFADEYTDEMDQKGSRDQTYLREDYIQLVALAIAVRLLIPVWSEFIAKTRKEIGSTFKEHYAFKLLKGSPILSCPAMLKLRLYIEHALSSDNDVSSLMFSGYSSQDIPVYMMALVLIRRLTIGDLAQSDESAGNLVTFVYKFMTNKINQGWKQKPAETIRDKEVPSGSEEGDEKTSSLERYKIKFRLAPGEIEEFEFVLSQHQLILDKLAPGIDMKLVDEAIKSLDVLKDLPIRDSHIQLISWMFSAYISPKALWYVSRETVLNCLVLAQAIFWHHGFRFLSITLASHVYESPDDEMIIGSADSKERVSKEMHEELEATFPYTRQSGRKSKQVKIPNAALVTISNLIARLSVVTWRTVCSDYFMNNYYGNSYNRIVVIPTTIRVELVRLVLFITARKKEAVLSKRREMSL